MRGRLTSGGELDPRAEAELLARIDQEIEHAFQFALDSPLPTSVEGGVYA